MSYKYKPLPIIDDHTLDIKALRDKQMGILKEFIEVCKKLNLRYYLCAGTALGAVRHKGYIPWDDDIDIMIPRSDYDIFLKEGEKYLSKNLFIQTYETDRDYRKPFGKIRDTSTCYVESASQMLNINHGVYIDLFPIDGFPNDNKKEKKLMKADLMAQYVLTKGVYPYTFKEKLKHLLGAIYYGTGNHYKVLKKFDKKCKAYKYDDEEYTMIYFGGNGIDNKEPKSTFGKGHLAQFEDIKAILPDETDKYLTHIYGDYMTPPKEVDRVGHHYCVLFDPNKSYKELLKR